MKLEVMKFGNLKVTAPNVSAIVGHGGANRRGDVMLIQGMLKYIGELMPHAVGLGGEYNIPAINGEMDADTFSAIAAFQVRNAGNLLMKYFDTRIHPASYAGRTIQPGEPRYMSITWLHFLATEAQVLRGDRNYIQTMASSDANLAYYIDGAVIGVERT